MQPQRIRSGVCCGEFGSVPDARDRALDTRARRKVPDIRVDGLERLGTRKALAFASLGKRDEVGPFELQEHEEFPPTALITTTWHKILNISQPQRVDCAPAEIMRHFCAAAQEKRTQIHA